MKWTRARALGAVCLGLPLFASACTRSDPDKLIGAGAPAECPAITTGPTGGATTTASGAGPSTGATTSQTTGSSVTTGSGMEEPEKTALDARVLSYTEALRTASFKIIGNAPTYAQIESLRTAGDQAARYAEMVDELMADGLFADRMVELWQNTMRLGGDAPAGMPSYRTAPTFAARILVEGLPYTDLFTATTNTCPTFDAATHTFANGECDNTQEKAGVLTDPGFLSSYYGSFAFRRHRFVQEVFACSAQPAEPGQPQEANPPNGYNSPWNFKSIAGTENGGRVDFLDTSISMCANCHSTANHRSPLFAAYDAAGQYVDPAGGYAVTIPIEGTPFAQRSDYLPAGEPTAWKFGVYAATMQELGQKMAEDAEVQKCAVTRMWNYAMSKGDVVYDVSDVPDVVIQPLIDDFKANNFNLRKVLRAIFVHDDFVRF